MDFIDFNLIDFIFDMLKIKLIILNYNQIKNTNITSLSILLFHNMKLYNNHLEKSDDYFLEIGLV